MNFIAMDFETANRNRGSACEIGLVKVENFEIVERRSFLIRPKENRFDGFHTRLHGIDAEMVADSPEFDVVYAEIKEDLEASPLLMHFAQFDVSVLRHALDLYGLPYPELTYACTYEMAKRADLGLLSYRLDSLCRHFGIVLEEHHRALPDALACAMVGIRLCRMRYVSDFEGIVDGFDMGLGKVWDGGYLPSGAKYARDFDLKDLEVDGSKFDERSPFFGKQVIFTGKMEALTRKEAQVRVLEIGGLTSNAVSKKTGFLVMGEQDVTRWGAGHKSTKLKKAEQLLGAGQEIELLSEGQFLEMLEID